MNGARSTFMRKGYLLTALAAAVLLAASPGIASAQSIGFSGSSRSMMEGAAPGMGTPDPITVTINISGLTLEGDDANRETGLGTITLVTNADTAYSGQTERQNEQRRVWIDGSSSAVDEARLDSSDEHSDAPGKYGVSTGDEIPYDGNGVITLVIIDPGGDGNWVDNMFTMNIESDALGISPSPGSFRVTVRDTDVAPVAAFGKSSVRLTEGSATTGTNAVTVTVAVPKGTKAANTPAGISELTNNIRFSASPEGAAVDECPAATADNYGDAVVAVTPNGITLVASGDNEGQYMADAGAGNLAATASFGLEACGDMSGFNDEMVTFSFVAASLMGAPAGYGNLAAGPDLVVTVFSEGEATPTVSFATSSLSIDEGSTETVAILADGALGPEVGSVMVSMSGDATLSLWQGMTMLEADDDGMFAVDLGGSANTILTVSADSDRALEDGMTATGTLTIESANGANIGDRDSVMVTVSGSTAVAALPLLGQLLLALFLMAGGARLYRRRNG